MLTATATPASTIHRPVQPARRWRGRLAAIAALGALGTSTAVFAVTSSKQDHPNLSAGQVLAFEEESTGVTRILASVLEPQLGGDATIKASLGPIEQGSISDDEAQRRCSAWRQALDRAQRQADAIAVPSALRTARADLVRSIAGYRRAVAKIEAAVAVPAGTRTPAINDAVAEGHRADRLYDRVTAALRAARANVGMPPDPRLPDPDQPLPPGVEVVNP